jgi:hypothetical protein
MNEPGRANSNTELFVHFNVTKLELNYQIFQYRSIDRNKITEEKNID